MTVTYFKRYRMQLRIEQSVFERLGKPQQSTPDGFRLIPWSAQLLKHHAEVKFESFKQEIDAHVFPCLADIEGCRKLMRDISGRRDFLPQATWLVARDSEFSEQLQPCGTIQGLRANRREGAIQNIGVHPDFRGLGLGTLMLSAAIEGYHAVGCRYVNLEVTTQNTAAIRLYERIGFRVVETLFKVADVQYA